MFECIVLSGPTASGKSGLSLEIAKKINKPSCIINADSRQVYDGLKILTAQPLEKPIPHFLYGYKSPTETLNAVNYAMDVIKIIEENKHLFPIIVGGTGLYIQALLNGMSNIPPRPLYTKYDNYSLEECMQKLKIIDPIYASKIRDKQRAIRALDVYDQTGMTMTALHSVEKKPMLNKKCLKLYIDNPNLKNRIMSRLTQDIDIMIEEVVNEYTSIQNTHTEKSIGVYEINQYLANKINKTELIQMIYHKTWQYAKRQRTWFKKHYNPDQILTNNSINDIIL